MQFGKEKIAGCVKKSQWIKKNHGNFCEYIHKKLQKFMALLR